MFDIEFKGIRTETKGVAVTRRPNIPAPEPNGIWVQVAGKDGSVFQWDGTYKNIEIPVPLNFVRARKYWMETYREIKSWITGAGPLVMGDDPGWFYKCKTAFINDTRRKAWVGGELDARFVCDPYQYQEGAQAFMSFEEAQNNPYALAKPKYRISGSGACVLSVNGKTASLTASGTIIIDTDRMVAYTEDGTITNSAFDAGSNYEKLWLEPGKNEIEILTGVNLEIAPCWRSL